MDFREKGAQERGYHGELDFLESTSRQRLQPCSSAFYTVQSDSVAPPLIFSIADLYGFQSFFFVMLSLILFIIVCRDSNGNPVLDKTEDEHGGWLVLTLNYIHKVFMFFDASIYDYNAADVLRYRSCKIFELFFRRLKALLPLY